MVLLAASCGGGSDRDGRASAQASDPEAVEVARQLSAGDAQAADAVAAAQAAAQATDSEAAQGLFGFGGRIRQVVVFGDSLSDVGTYQVGDIAAVGGGKFTTNPGWVWPEVHRHPVRRARHALPAGLRRRVPGGRGHRLRDGRLARVAAAGHRLRSGCRDGSLHGKH